MDTWLVDAHPPLEIDPLIVRAVRSGADALAGGGIALNMGIRAANGQIYRVARAWDLADYQRASAALERLGLVRRGYRTRLHNISFEDVFEFAEAARLRA
jgi:hypothetical protein